ncbi:MAG: hypothetical protein JXQ90_00755 [Cyclobacteriaceae bacterium]
MKNQLPIIFLAFLLTACEGRISLTHFKYKTESIDLVSDLLNEDYESVIDQFDFSIVADSVLEKQSNQLLNGLSSIVKNIEDNFGDSLKLKFAFTESSVESDGENTLRYSTTYIQFENEEFYGQLTLKYDDDSEKLRTINLEDFRKYIPNTLEFWLLGIYPLLVLIINITAIRKVVKSNLNKKWLFIFLIVLLNFPTVNIHWHNEIYINSVLQFLLGIGLDTRGYNNMIWSFGLPFGAIFIYGYIKSKE